MCSVRFGPHARDFPHSGQTTRSPVPLLTRDLDEDFAGGEGSTDVPTCVPSAGLWEVLDEGLVVAVVNCTGCICETLVNCTCCIC